MLGFFLNSYKATYGLKFAPLHDPCAVYYIINPDAFEIKNLNVEIETESKFCDGRTVVDIYNVLGKPHNANVAVKIDTEKFWEAMLAAIKICNERSPINK